MRRAVRRQRFPTESILSARSAASADGDPGGGLPSVPERRFRSRAA